MQPPTRPLAIFTLCLGAALTGCSQPTESVTEPAGEEAAPAAAPTPSAPPATTWAEIEPGSPAICSDGSDYRFFVRNANPDKLLVYLQGGGGCWRRDNCDVNASPSYSISVGDFHPERYDGIFDLDNPANPFADYSIVFAPYCTGDIHLGASDTAYESPQAGGAPLIIHHQGVANVSAVLDFTYATFDDPREIFVTGSSAGSIPSPYYAVQLAERYPRARIAQLGDAAGGYRQTDEFTLPHATWKTLEVLNQHPAWADETAATFNYERIYIGAGRYLPDARFAEYDTAEDAVQLDFLKLMGSSATSLEGNLRANYADINAATGNFASFMAGGDVHMILMRPEFYTYAEGEVSIRDWVADLAAGRPVESFACTDCRLPDFAGAPMPAALKKLWLQWESPAQAVAPFRIFDNLYYVGIEWVAAYVLETSDGLILIDSLYGKWIEPMIANIAELGLDPADIRYVLVTHGHFDHHGGAALIQERYGARVVMAEEDWLLAEQPADNPLFAAPVPRRDIVAEDGNAITLGDTTVTLYKTPGHSPGVLSMRYQVRDGDDVHEAITLGGVGLNFSGVERTEQYLKSYARLQSMAAPVSVSLPNHAAMGRVFELRDELAKRQPGQPHPFVDASAYRQALERFFANAEQKLVAEKNGTATDPMEELNRAVTN